jgi:hypothetical protein
MDVVNFDALKAQGKIIKISDVNPDEDYFIIGHYDPRRREFKATDYPIYAIKARDVLNSSNAFNNPFDFYLDGNAPAGGDGSASNPFNLFSQAVAYINTLPSATYTLYVLPYSYTESSPVINLPNNSALNIIGVVANSCSFNFNVQFTAIPASSYAVWYENIAFSNFELDLSLASFASISFTGSKVDLIRTDSNPSTIVTLQGAMFASTLSGRVLWLNGVMFGDINVQTNGELFCNTVLQLQGQFKLTGSAKLKTLSMPNPTPNGVDGIPVGLNIPVWRTDAASDETFTGTLTKIIY